MNPRKPLQRSGFKPKTSSGDRDRVGSAGSIADRGGESLPVVRGDRTAGSTPKATASAWPRKPRTRNRQKWALTWPQVRKAKVEANPYCERCGVPTEVVHHLAGRAGKLLVEWDNLCSLCNACHEWAHHNVAAAYEQGWMRKRLGGAA